MTISLLTEGLIGGGSSDSSPPSITAVSPTPNTTPGTGGGMSATYGVAKDTPIVVQITDSDGASNLAFVSVSVVFLDGTVEAAYRGNFLGEYLVDSYKLAITNGIELHLRRADSWPGAGLASNLAVGLQIDAVDAGGNVTSTILYYQMPPASIITPVVIPANITGAVDVVQAGIGRLISQLRSL